MSRPITKLVPDLREMLQDALEETAKQVHEDLWNKSPWWSGQFANSWEVLPGIRSIKPNIASADNKQGGKGGYPGVTIPASPGLKGYSIGNRTKYRLSAMDLKGPHELGRRAPTFRTRNGKPVDLSAPKYWYDNYLNTGIRDTIETTIANVFRRYS